MVQHTTRLAAQGRDLGSECDDFRNVCIAGGGALLQAEQELVAGSAGEFQARRTRRADGSVIVFHCFYTGQILQAVDPGLRLRAGVPDDVELGLQIAKIAGVEADRVIFGGVREDFVPARARGSR